MVKRIKYVLKKLFSAVVIAFITLVALLAVICAIVFVGLILWSHMSPVVQMWVIFMVFGVAFTLWLLEIIVRPVAGAIAEYWRQSQWEE